MTGSSLAVGLVRLDQIRLHPHNVRYDLVDLSSITALIIKVEQRGAAAAGSPVAVSAALKWFTARLS